ncbi:hypothetical protein QUF80_23500 [Desulfococcaceae bacterium HSG8]|nr:hypothetical protein [Desulfococcaceae bacterium HSG8]
MSAEKSFQSDKYHLKIYGGELSVRVVVSETLLNQPTPLAYP